MASDRCVITDGVTNDRQRAELRNWFFSGWRQLHPAALTDADWEYAESYFAVSNVGDRLDILEIQDEGLLNAIERFARYRFSYLLEYLYHFQPKTPDLELIVVFHKDVNPKKNCFKIRVGDDFKYVVAGRDLDEDGFADFIQQELNRIQQFLAVQKCTMPVACLQDL